VEQLGVEEVSQNDSPAVKEARYLSLSIQIEHVQPWKKRQNLLLGVRQMKHLNVLWHGPKASSLVNWPHYLAAY
jgi:hypothetical protein